MISPLLSLPLLDPSASLSVPIALTPTGRKVPLLVNAVPTSRVAASHRLPLAIDGHHVLYGSASKYCRRFCGLKKWIVKSLNLRQPNRKRERGQESEILQIRDEDNLVEHDETILSNNGQVFKRTFTRFSNVERSMYANSTSGGCSTTSLQSGVPAQLSTLMESSSYLPQAHSTRAAARNGAAPFLCIAVIGATGELARTKIFPALFALYYSGFLPENVGIFGYSRKNLKDEDLRSIIASTLTCRIDYQQDCGDKMDIFLSRIFYINGGDGNIIGMSKLHARMEEIEGESEANRIFYLSVPQEVLLDVALSLADNAQSQKGWNRVIIEKPFGIDLLSSYQLTQSLLCKFEEKQLYRIDHLLGRNTIENLTVLRFSNLVFQPLWNRNYIRNVQVILSEDSGISTQGRSFDGYGIIGDVVHSHILQTIALLSMEPPVSLDGEDIRNEKVKVLRSIRKLELSDIILGQYKASFEDKNGAYLDGVTPTFFAAAIFIDNARWDGVPFLIKAGKGLINHRVEIRIQFRHVPGNLYRERIGHNVDLATNELILRDVPDEAILVRVNNKIPGLGLQLDASELNLLYKDRYNVEVPDSYEHLLLDVIDGDNHLFMRSDEVAAAWNILSPVLQKIDEKNVAPELYELGGRGPTEAFYLWAKHGVKWVED